MRERTQWDSGANLVCASPGVVYAYDRNTYTNTLLRKEGIEVDHDRRRRARTRPRRRTLHDLPDHPRRRRLLTALQMAESLPAPTNSEVETWHALGADEVLKRQGTDVQTGLDPAEATRRLEQHGRNRLPEGVSRSAFVKLLLQFHNVLVYVLLGAGFVKLMLGLWLDASVILGVVVLNGLLGFVQEGRAEKALDSIRNMLSAEARTVRGGQTQMVAAEELVPGDVVLLESGDRIPADLRLVDVKNLRTEEAALTGESVPADKSTDAVAANATVGDRDCMAYSGTLVVSGRATGDPLCAKWTTRTLSFDRGDASGAELRIEAVGQVVADGPGAHVSDLYRVTRTRRSPRGSRPPWPSRASSSMPRLRRTDRPRRPSDDHPRPRAMCRCHATRSRVTSDHCPRCMAGMTVSVAIVATPSTPQRILRTGW